MFKYKELPLFKISLLFFVSTLISFGLRDKFLLQFLNFSLIIVFLIGLVIFSLRHCCKDYFQFKKYDVSIIVGLLFCAVFSRVYQIDKRSLWLDEDEVIGEILGYYASAYNGFFDIVSIAANTQQPPLDYFFEAIGIFLIGESSWGARIHAVFFGVLTVISMYLLLRFLTKSYLWSAIGSILTLMHPLLVYYSQEGRPNSTAVFFTILYLFSVSNYFLRGRTKHGLYLVFAIQTLYLFVIGMQPPIIIFWSTLLFSFLFYKGRNSQKPKNLLGKVAICSFLIYLPYLLYITIIAYADSYLHLDTNIKHFNTSHLFYTVFYLYMKWFFFGVFIAVLLMIFNCFSRRSIEHSDRLFIAFILLLVLFLLSIVFAFNSFINWYLQKRYIIVAIPIFIIVFVLALQRINNLLHGLPYGRIVTSVFFLPFLIPIYQNALHMPSFYGHNNSVVSPRTNWKDIYSYIKLESTANDVVLLLDMVEGSSGWSMDGSILHNVYMPSHGKISAYVYSQHDKKTYIDSLRDIILKRKGTIKNIFLIVQGFYFYDEKMSIELKKHFKLYVKNLLEIHPSSWDALVFKLDVSHNLAKRLNNFYIELETVLKKSEIDFNFMPMYLSLGHLGVEFGSTKQVREYLHKIKSSMKKDNWQDNVEELQSFIDTSSIKNDMVK